MGLKGRAVLDQEAHEREQAVHHERLRRQLAEVRGHYKIRG